MTLGDNTQPDNNQVDPGQITCQVELKNIMEEVRKDVIRQAYRTYFDMQMSAGNIFAVSNDPSFIHVATFIHTHGGPTNKSK